jgi:putative thioredoxin
MLDISIQNFQDSVIAASMQHPVLLDIWAPWCGPCKALGPVLEQLEEAYTGRFTLGKLNSDEQPDIAGQLSQMFGVRSIPFCVLFKDGQPVDGFVGALPEAQIRTFLDKHIPSVEQTAAQQEVMQAESLLAEGDVDSAIQKLQEAVALNPDNEAARYDCLHALLTAGRVTEARSVYEPVANQVIPNARLAACGHWLTAYEYEQSATARPVDQLEANLTANKRDFDARFELAQHHFAAQRFTQAMDELLEILMRDKTWRDAAARKTYVAILEVMRRPALASAEVAKNAAPKSTINLAGHQPVVPTDPVVDTYRRRLSMVIF